MLSNGFGCIKKCSNTLKTSLFDWILHKFNVIDETLLSGIIVKYENYTTNITLSVHNENSEFLL